MSSEEKKLVPWWVCMVEYPNETETRKRTVPTIVLEPYMVLARDRDHAVAQASQKAKSGPDPRITWEFVEVFAVPF